jgi:hypothetical protein
MDSSNEKNEMKSEKDFCYLIGMPLGIPPADFFKSSNIIYPNDCSPV